VVQTTGIVLYFRFVVRDAVSGAHRTEAEIQQG